MPSLTLYISVWAGLILVGLLLGYNTYTENIQLLFTDPIYGITNLLSSAFSDTRFLILVTSMALISGGASYLITGSSYSVFFAIPLLIIFGLLNIFVLPTSAILKSDMPDIAKNIYIVLIGSLTMLTAVTFITGRA